MRQGNSLPVLMIGAILALGPAMASALQRLSADGAAMTVLGGAFTLVRIAASPIRIAYQVTKTSVIRLGTFCTLKRGSLCFGGLLNEEMEKE